MYNNTSYSDVLNIKQHYTSLEEEKVVAATKNIKCTNIENDLMIIQAIVFEFQRLSGNEEEFDKYLYDKLNATSKSIDSLLHYYDELVKQVQYIKDVTDSLKAAQQMTEGYSEYNRKKDDIDTSGLNSIGTISNLSVSIRDNLVGSVQSFNAEMTNNIAKQSKSSKLSL